MDTGHFKQKLEEELKLVESELSNIGSKNPLIDNNVTDWQPKPADLDIDTADDTELGDKFEEYEENTAILKNLEIRYNNIKRALDKINLPEGQSTYGKCEVCGASIEEDRLEANPSAKTCKEHMNG